MFRQYTENPWNSLPHDVTVQPVKMVVHKGTSQPRAGRGQGRAFWRGDVLTLVFGGLLHNMMLQLDYQLVPLLH